ncbi:FecR family protein [Fulvivirga ulvae]|uniref:FecR family protein n=1 Tax=Fulvivirga ulvae TaxID=2904245 RepID=UPI001F187BD3|nr:FecR family protein [Fulvivirga ulvae]UII33451.1 FecR family protein [Fulvivirga ulvae]
MSNSGYDKEKLLRLINNELGDDELHKLSADPDFQKYKAILNEVDSWKLPELDIAASYDRLKNKKTKTPAKTINWYQTNVFRMAAVLLLLATALTYFIVSGNSVVTYETGVAEMEEITLPDGSVIHLGASSQLSYNKDTWEETREIHLKGTSHFDVMHKDGAPFKVHFKLGTAEVLGTAFEVKSFEDFASVMCYDGKVKVNASDSTITLIRGRGARVRGRGLRGFEFQNHNWSQTITRFDSAPLSAVFTTMEAQFDIRIKADEIDITRTFTGSYSLQDVDLALKAVCNPMNISYEKNGNTVTLQ